VSNSDARWLALTTLVIVVAFSACGGSSGSPTSVATNPSASVAGATSPTSAPLPSITATAAAPSCPTAATVGAALGISVSAPTSVKGGGGTQLPPGATAVACDYHGTALNVIIELLTNVDPSTISQFSPRFPVPYASVSGVGDQARSFSQSLGGGKDNEGVAATKGSNLVAITATATPASLAQVEALVNQLL
jgi:hypothetical protein